MVCTTPSKKPLRLARGPSGMRVAAKAKARPNTTSGSILPSAAAAKAFDGTKLRNHAAADNGVAAGATPDAASSDRAASVGIGTSCSSSGVTMTLIVPPAMTMAANHSSPRPAVLLALAVPAALAMPVNSSAKTSGMMVICSASSQMPPTGSATLATAATVEGAAKAANAIPPPRPSTSATKMRTVRLMMLSTQTVAGVATKLFYVGTGTPLVLHSAAFVIWPARSHRRSAFAESSA